MLVLACARKQGLEPIGYLAAQRNATAPAVGVLAPQMQRANLHSDAGNTRSAQTVELGCTGKPGRIIRADALVESAPIIVVQALNVFLTAAFELLFTAR